MKMFKVRVREEHFQDVLVEAASEEDAIMSVREGEGEYKGCEFHVTCDPEDWEVYAV